MDLQKRIALILLLIVCVSFEFQIVNAREGNNNQYFDTNQYIEEDFFVLWVDGKGLSSPYVYIGGVIFVNITLLSSSNSNITLSFKRDDRIEWDPVPPQNFTLNQGENYSQTFALESSLIDYHGNIHYNCMILQEHSNATIRFGYNVINTGTYPMAIGFEPVIIVLVLSSIALYLNKRKIKKEY